MYVEDATKLNELRPQNMTQETLELSRNVTDVFNSCKTDVRNNFQGLIDVLRRRMRETGNSAENHPARNKNENSQCAESPVRCKIIR